MKYSVIALICIFMLALFYTGCMGGGETDTTPAPADNSGDAVNTGEETGEKTGGETCEGTCGTCEGTCEGTCKETVSSDFEIPMAKDIDESLKTQVDELVTAISGAEDWQARKEPQDKLKAITEENPSDMALFAYLIQQPNTFVSMDAMVAMGKCKDEDKEPVKFEIYTYAVKHPSDYMRYYAFDHLRDAKTDEEKAKSLELAGEALDDPSGHVRGRGCWYIGYVRDNTHNEKLKEIMKNDDAPQAVANAIEALDNSGEDITADIMEIIDDLHPYAKCSAITVLENKKYKDAVPKLVEMLDDTTKTYYGPTFDNGDTMNYNALKPTVQEMAIHGLERITEEKFEGDDTATVVAKWKEWSKTAK